MAQDQRDSGAAISGQGLRALPPRMTRSQPQLATAYAPGAIFTWEGGKGACLSVPIDGATIDFSTRQTRRDGLSRAFRSSAKTGWLAAWRSIATRLFTSSSSWTVASTTPCARGRLRLISRSIVLSFYGQSAWVTYPDRLFTVATRAGSCANMFRRPTKLRNRFPSPARPRLAIRPMTLTGDNLTSSTHIGQAWSRGYRPIDTQWTGGYRPKNSALPMRR